MGLLSRFLLLFSSLARWPLRAWVRTRMTPSDLNELDWVADKPICYVLATGGLSDRLALEATCVANGLTRPSLARNRLPTIDKPGVLTLPARRQEARSELRRIIVRGLHDPNFNVQLVPVSIFWGRNPAKETSLLRILFSDSERPGRLRKLLIILVQGHNVLVHLGQPLDYRAFVSTAHRPGTEVRKLNRLLRIHFRRQRGATLGPPRWHRSQVINAILADPEVRTAIDRAARTENTSVEAVRARARRYGDEIAADYSNIAIGFMQRLLTWLWNRIYDGVDVRHLQRLRRTARDAAVVYLPSHRSHMDYLLVSYILYTEGIALPQVAAGSNLNFWPIGSLLRRCGAFYLRRRFGGDKLYAAAFRAYVDVLIGRGQSFKFYLEGGRSRTGRLLPPQTGMLAMAASSLLQHRDRPTALVPVYIGYDRVMEVNSYFDELRGSRQKKGESLLALFRSSRKILKRKYGRAYIAFGEPLRLTAFADAQFPGWRDCPPSRQAEARPPWLGDFAQALSETMMARINATATLNATGLVALILLGSPQQAVAEDEMIHTLALLARLARICPYSPDSTAPEADGAALLAEAEPLMQLQRLPHAWGDILTVDSRQAVLLTYSRNNVMHLFALTALLANTFTQREQRSVTTVLRDGTQLYPLLASELSLRWSPDEVGTALRRALDGMVECGVLERADGGMLRRPAAGTRTFAALMSLARIVRESLERVGMTAALLANNMSKGCVERSAFERQCQIMAERMALISGRNSPEFFDPRLFRNHLQTLQRNGLLAAEGSKLRINPGMRRLAEHTLQLLGPDIRQSILHLTSQPSAANATIEANRNVADSRAAQRLG